MSEKVKTNLEVDDITVKNLKADTISVKSYDGEHGVLIKAFVDGVGMWFGDGQKNSFVVWDSQVYGKYVGISAPDICKTAYPLAISIQDKDITLQIFKNGETVSLSLLDLYDKI